MELKIWVEGIQRIVCGVTEQTTCQDVVFALAHATGKSGRFILIERWRNNERQLPPHEHPMKLLTKWGEYSNDVQFILQWSDVKNLINKGNLLWPSSFCNNVSVDEEKSNEFVKFSPTNTNKQMNNVGVVKGIPQVRPLSTYDQQQNNNNINCSVPADIQKPLSVSCASPLVRSDNTVSYSPGSGRIRATITDYERASTGSSPSIGTPTSGGSVAGGGSIISKGSPSNGTPITLVGGEISARSPPPYRDPPAPKKANFNMNSTSPLQSAVELKNEETVTFNNQYRQLINLVNCQREKLSNQQVDLTKFDAEILYWEAKEREKEYKLQYLNQEIADVTNTSKLNCDQIQGLTYVEEENEIVKQQEKILMSEVTLIRSKLANCETELLQCKNKIRLLLDELHLEQKNVLRRNESKKQLERNLFMEIERLQRDIEIAKQSTDLHQFTADTLRKEVSDLEIAIVEKKKQVERLVNEMKEANLLSLSIAAQEELLRAQEQPPSGGASVLPSTFGFGPSSAGLGLGLTNASNAMTSSHTSVPVGGGVPPRRRMIGSPRQLENAVPTNKNPHGVWV